MDVAKKRAVIKQNAIKKKEVEGELKEMGVSNPLKRKPQEKQSRQPKKPKIVLEPVVGLEAEGMKTVTPTKHGVGKGLMKGPSTTQEKPPILLREDSKFALEKLSSIVSIGDYEDLGNHATEAMGETGLFSLVQVCYIIHFLFFRSPNFATNNLYFQAMVIMKGLMGWCLNHEMALKRIRAKENKSEEELNSLKTWKVNMEKKLSLSEKVRKELNQQVETLGKVLEDKEKEIKDAKDQLYQSKEAAICEYRNSDALLEDFGTSYTDGFDDAIRQAKRAYPDLDFSQLSIDTQPQATVQPIAFKSMKDLFADNAAPGDGDLVPLENQAQPVDGDIRQPAIVEDTDKITSPQQ